MLVFPDATNVPLIINVAPRSVIKSGIWLKNTKPNRTANGNSIYLTGLIADAVVALYAKKMNN